MITAPAKRACLVFWKEAWLRKSDGERSVAASGSEPAQALRARLKTATPAGTYFCQSTELAQATFPLTRGRRVLKWFRDVRERTYPWRQMPGLVLLPVVRKIRRKLVGETLRGHRAPTPTETLNLQPGEWVEVKPLKAILQTLDANGKNRGLHFSEDMAAFCGRAFRVRDRLDRMISEVTGQMQEMKNTVILEDVRCACPYTLGGCPRGSFQVLARDLAEAAPPDPKPPGPHPVKTTCLEGDRKRPAAGAQCDSSPPPVSNPASSSSPSRLRICVVSYSYYETDNRVRRLRGGLGPSRTRGGGLRFEGAGHASFRRYRWCDRPPHSREAAGWREAGGVSDADAAICLTGFRSRRRLSFAAPLSIGSYPFPSGLRGVFSVGPETPGSPVHSGHS